jgi:hypothetical protein
MNRTELLTRIQVLQSENLDREVTRKLFRDSTQILDSVWEKHFGTFTQYKIAAGLDKSKIAKKITYAVARHSAIDTLKELDTEKNGWGEAYLKPSDSRFQTILTGSDIHDKLCDPFYRRLFIHTANRVQPEKIILVGDIFDCYEFSKYTKDARKVDIISSINWVHSFLEDLRNVAPNSEIVFIGGNHEHRLIRYLSEEAPSLIPILSDLHGFTVPSLLGLQKFEINFISKDTLGVFNESDIRKEIAKNYYIAYDAVLFHHFPYAKFWGMPGVNGHHHSHKQEVFFSARYGPYEWHQLGAGHIRQAEYTEGEKWTNGFALIHVDTHTKAVQFEYIDLTGPMCVIGGKWYTRLETEIIK